MTTLQPGERIDNLQFSNLRIIQSERAFSFGTDAVLLADFAGPRPHDAVADLGTGTGILPILMAGREPTARFDALEIQPDAAERAKRSVELNGLEGRIAVQCGDLRQAGALLGYEKKTLVVCNPPYGRVGAALVNPNESLRIARHEQSCTLEDVARAAFSLLKTRGRLCVVYPAARMFELMQTLSAHRLEPKRVRCVHEDVRRAPKLMLLEAVKDGGAALHWMPPLILNDEAGQRTEEYRRIYHTVDLTQSYST